MSSIVAQPMESLIQQERHARREHVQATQSVSSNSARVLLATYLILLQHLFLLQCLHCVNLSGIRLLNHPHLNVRLAQVPQRRLARSVQRTSPNAPLPITFTVLKSSKPSFVLLKRKNADSLFPNCRSHVCCRHSV